MFTIIICYLLFSANHKEKISIFHQYLCCGGGNVKEGFEIFLNGKKRLKDKEEM